MNILIIGGTGLISTPITRLLLDRGDEVTLYNRGSTPRRFGEGARVMTGDRREAADFEAQMAEQGPFDCVIDMVLYEPQEAESAIRAFRGRVGQYLFCSTVDVYTKPAACYPIREDEERQPRESFPYAWKKARIELLLEQAHGCGDFPLTIIRPAHTYGETRALISTLGGGPRYLDRIRKGEPIVVHGDGTSLWASCHAEDVARAFVAAAGSAATLGRAYHVTGEEWMTWDRYHQTIAMAMGARPPDLVHIPTDLLLKVAPERARITAENFQFNNIFDNSAARSDLAFRYTIPFLEGVRRVVAWLEENGRLENSDDDPVEDRIITDWRRLGDTMAGQ